MSFWQQYQRFTIAPAGTATFTLKANEPLEGLALWAVSGAASVSMTFQPQVNGNAFGLSSNVVAAPAALLIYSSGGATVENTFLPRPPPHAVPVNAHPFVFTVLITNDGADSADITIYATARAVP